MYNNFDDTIYLSFAENDKMFFFLLNATDGSTSKIYSAAGVSIVLTSHLYDSETVFISALSVSDSSNYIIMYHVNNASFTNYKFVNATIHIWGISYDSKNSRLVLFGSINNQYVYGVHTLVDSISEYNRANEETTQIFIEQNSTNFQLASVSTGLSTNGYTPISDYSTLPSPVTRTMNIDIDQYSDLVYYLETPTNSEYFSLMEGWNQTLPINITCSV